ncbi:MAG: hypothetical protein ACFB5Z_03425 [Elainellaceae cyanobacterium]
MSSYNQSDKPPQWDRPLVNAIGVAIALLTLVVPLAAITFSSANGGEPWPPSYNSLPSD